MGTETNWTEQNDLGTARSDATGAGSQPSALMSGGYDGSSVVASVEQWTGAGAKHWCLVYRW